MGTRVSLDSVVYAWRFGRKPEEIHQSFPSLPLAAVYGSVAYYLDHQVEIDAYLLEGEQIYERARAQQQAADPEFYARMRQKIEEERSRINQLPSQTPSSCASTPAQAAGSATTEALGL